MDQNDNNRNQPAGSGHSDSPIKQAAMAAFGALSSAAQKAADVIGEAVSKENREKYAKKGEETFSAVKDKGEDIFRQVKDLGAQTVESIKAAMEDPAVKPYTTPEAAKEALQGALEDLHREVENDRRVLGEGLDDDLAVPFAEQLIRGLRERATLTVKLARHLQALVREQQEGPAAPAEEAPEAQDEDTYFDQPVEGDIPYDSPDAPSEEGDRVEKAPADEGRASATAPDKDSNFSVLETDMKNEHLNQSVPPELG